MRILMFTDYFYPYVGGDVEKVVYEVAKRLPRMGCEVSVATLGRNIMDCMLSPLICTNIFFNN